MTTATFASTFSVNPIYQPTPRKRWIKWAVPPNNWIISVMYAKKQVRRYICLSTSTTISPTKFYPNQNVLTITALKHMTQDTYELSSIPSRLAPTLPLSEYSSRGSHLLPWRLDERIQYRHQLHSELRLQRDDRIHWGRSTWYAHVLHRNLQHPYLYCRWTNSHHETMVWQLLFCQKGIRQDNHV